MKYNTYSTVLPLLLFVFIFAGNCKSQFDPIVNRPLKVLEIEWMSESLDMTDDQSEALLEKYEYYLDAFSNLSQNEIKNFEASLAEAEEIVGFMSFMIPERDVVKELIAKANRSIRAVKRVDNDFFDSCSEMLTEKQVKKLQRIRIERELRHYEVFVTETLGNINDGAKSYLQGMFDRIDTEPNESIEIILETYRTRYLKETIHGFNELIDCVELALDMIDELGFANLSDFELYTMAKEDENLMEDLKRRGAILFLPLMKKAVKVSQLNWSAWKKLDGLLPEEDAQLLQNYYFKKSFREVMYSMYTFESKMNSALNLEGLTDVQQNGLHALDKEFAASWQSR